MMRRLRRMRAAERMMAVVMVGIIAGGAGLIGQGLWLKLTDPHSASRPPALVSLEDSPSVSAGPLPPGRTGRADPLGMPPPAVPFL